VRDLPAEHRLEAIRRLVRSLRRVYDAQGAARPEWLDRLSATWLEDDELEPPRGGGRDE